MWYKHHNQVNEKDERESFLCVPIVLYIQLWSITYVRLLNNPYENEVTLREQKIPLKCWQPLGFMYTFRNISIFYCCKYEVCRSKGFKVRGRKKKSTTPAITAEMCASTYGPDLTPPRSESFYNLTDGNFGTLWPTNPILDVWKDLNFFSMYIAVQELAAF